MPRNLYEANHSKKKEQALSAAMMSQPFEPFIPATRPQTTPIVMINVPTAMGCAAMGHQICRDPGSCCKPKYTTMLQFTSSIVALAAPNDHPVASFI
jgi:hypothetical protein